MLALVLAFVLRADEPSAVVFGAELFGEFFPRSSQEIPGRTGEYQQSVLTGGRATIGYRHMSQFRGLLVLEGGYAAAGIKAGNGQDGFMIGIGAEGDYIIHPWLSAFVRVTGDFLVNQRGTLMTGTLADRALVFAFGVRVFRFVDLHLCAGSDFAGGFAIGMGAGLGWQWQFDLND